MSAGLLEGFYPPTCFVAKKKLVLSWALCSFFLAPRPNRGNSDCWVCGPAPESPPPPGTGAQDMTSQNKKLTKTTDQKTGGVSPPSHAPPECRESLSCAVPSAFPRWKKNGPAAPCGRGALLWSPPV